MFKYLCVECLRLSVPLYVCCPLPENLRLTHVQGAADVAEAGQGQLQVPDYQR